MTPALPVAVWARPECQRAARRGVCTWSAKAPQFHCAGTYSENIAYVGEGDEAVASSPSRFARRVQPAGRVV
jgi:hypothetical protein